MFIQEIQEEFIDDFVMFKDWMLRHEYVIEILY